MSSPQTSSNFNIDGNGVVGGTLGVGTGSSGSKLTVAGVIENGEKERLSVAGAIYRKNYNSRTLVAMRDGESREDRPDRSVRKRHRIHADRGHQVVNNRRCKAPISASAPQPRQEEVWPRNAPP